MRGVGRALPLFGVVACLVFCSTTAKGRGEAAPTSFFVAPNGSGSGDGSIENPWDLTTALAQPASVRPGDTIWLRGGTYSGQFTSSLEGVSGNPIIVRQYPGERATLDGGNSGGRAVLTINGAYSWFWGFEITSSDPNRQSAQVGSWPTDIGRGDGIDSGAAPKAGVKLINLVIHDTRQGVSAFVTWQDTEINGCLIYYNGWNGPDNGHGHGIYTQNQYGEKRVIDSIVFHQFSHGLHAYGSSTAYLNNYHVEGNTFFLNGDLETRGGGRDMLLGGDMVANNLTVLSNSIYFPPGGPASDFDLGYTGGCSNTTVQNNYVAANTFITHCLPTVMTGNTYYGNTYGFSTSQYANNTYLSSKPAANQVFVRPNRYESGRANVTIFNWSLSPSITIDLSTVLRPLDVYEIRNAQDFFGRPVLTGTYDGSPVAVPVTGLSVANPVGWPAPQPTGPEFNAFVVLRTRSVRGEAVRPGEPLPSPHAVDRPGDELSVSP